MEELVPVGKIEQVIFQRTPTGGWVKRGRMEKRRDRTRWRNS